MDDVVAEPTTDLETIVRELTPKVIGYCALQTRNLALAEDVAQEALTALVQRWRRLGPPASPAAFVFSIARRRVVRALVRRRLMLPLEFVRGRSNHEPSPEQRSIRDAERNRLIAALSRLRAGDRQVLLLTTVGELSVQEAADALGVSLSAVKMRALRARRRLREELEEGHGP